MFSLVGTLVGRHAEAALANWKQEAAAGFARWEQQTDADVVEVKQEADAKFAYWKQLVAVAVSKLGQQKEAELRVALDKNAGLSRVNNQLRAGHKDIKAAYDDVIQRCRKLEDKGICTAPNDCSFYLA